MMIYQNVENLLYYAQSNLLLDELDLGYARNLILDELKLTSYEQYEVNADELDALTVPDEVLNPIVNYAVDNGIITEGEREYFADKIMNLVMLKPSQVADVFADIHGRNPVKAFDWLYDYAVKSDYVKTTKLAENKHWEAKGTKGKIEITVNVCRPEKNNKDVEKQAKNKGAKYPECNICAENCGYSGGDTFRKTLRYVPIELGGEEWFWQYSPYSYFNHHGIAVNFEHTPMKVDAATIEKLLDFVDYMPNYFIGCNAALPRVGGSILAHDHFQGGGRLMPMHKAGAAYKIKSADYPYVDACVVDWYNNVIRLSCTNREKLSELVSKINAAWHNYSDESVDVLARSTEQHNAITPIVRKSDKTYIVDIILRNNRCNDKYPDGIFHAHPEYMNIKSESIGLIEAMGLFVLPGRLDKQLSEVEKYLTKENRYNAAALSEDMACHKGMIEKLMSESKGKLSPLEASLNVKDEVNRVCEEILRNTAVFKNDEKGVAAMDKFLASIGFNRK
jgi:UDPglucose--hexose-1-phosphate uridylyltransferase